MSAADSGKPPASPVLHQPQRGQPPPGEPERASRQSMAGDGKAVEPPAQVPTTQSPDSLGPAGEEPLLEAGSSLKRRLQRPSYFLTEGILYRQGKNHNQKFLFTLEEKKNAFWEAHVAEGRHYGSRSTCSHLSKKYYWPGVTMDVRKWIKQCIKCQDKMIRMTAQATLETDSMGEEGRRGPEEKRAPHYLCQEKGLFTFVSLQLLGPLQRTARGACIAFVAVDYFTKWVYAVPLQSYTPEETGRQIVELVKRFGLPEGIISAQPPSFILQLNKILKMTLKIQGNLVVEYNPQTDQCLENSKSFVRRLLSLVLTTNPTDWDQHLHKVFFLQNRFPGCEEVEDEEEEDLSSLGAELQQASSAPAENWRPFLHAPETPEDSPDSKRDSLEKAPNQDTCLYCNQLPEEGDSDVFAVLQCDRCPAWAHDLCVRRQHGQVYQKFSLRCRSCLLADVGAEPGPRPSYRALEAAWAPKENQGRPPASSSHLPSYQEALRLRKHPELCPSVPAPGRRTE